MNFKQYWTGLNAEGKRDLVEKLGITRVYASMLAHGHRQAGLKVLVKIKQATDGQVSMKDMRPDIYGE